MTDITLELANVTGGATAKHYSRPAQTAPAPQPAAPSRNPVTDCAMGAIVGGLFGAPLSGCVSGVRGGGGNDLLGALLSM
ncbi:MAG: hypothetical protein QM831_05205 [Kofleriaceae bacterium]